MKNIKLIIFMVFVVLMAVVLSIEVFLWMHTDFDPNYSAIDSCLDKGGAWDRNSNICRH